MHATQQPADYKQLLSRLCHLAALSETKAIEGVVNSLIVSVIEIDPNHPVGKQTEIDEALRTYFGVELDAKDLNTAIARLTQLGSLIRQPGTDSFALSPAARAEQLQRVTAASEIEERVKQQWLDSIRSDSPDLTEEFAAELWACLKAYLTRLFCRHGAQTALVLSGQRLADAELDKSVAELLTNAVAEECKTVNPDFARKAVKAFMREQTSERASYIAQLLDNTFSFYSLFTDEATQEYLKKALPRITVFLDTNFLFGVLNLHNNPQNEVSVELVSLVREQKLPFDLYYHEDSLVEMRETISRTQKRLMRNKWPPGLSRAALQTRALELSGLEIKFHEANAQHQVEPDAFFLKYRHVEKLLNGQGFKIYRRPDKKDVEKLDDRTLELVSQYKQFLEDTLPPHWQKPFNAIKHDIIVWCAAKSLRKTGASGLDVGALLLSADQRLFAYDWGVLSNGSNLGVVVLPSQLLQLLRPFVPRTADFDKKFAEVFALPEFRLGRSDFSQVTRRVLSFLASVKDITEETALAILADEILIGRLKNVEADEDIKAAIESEVLRKNAELEKKHRDVASQLETVRAEVASRQSALDEAQSKLSLKDQALADRSDDVQREKSEREHKEAEAAAARAEIALSRQELEATACSLKAKSEEASELKAQVATLEAGRVRNRKLLRVGGGVLLTLGLWACLAWLPAIQAWQWLQSHPHKLSLYLAAVMLAPAIAWAIFAWKGRIWALAGVILAVIIQLIGVL